MAGKTLRHLNKLVSNAIEKINFCYKKTKDSLRNSDKQH